MREPYTKAEVRTVFRLWTSRTNEDIAKAIKRPESAVFKIAQGIREAGYRLPRKHTRLDFLGTVRAAMKGLTK